MKAIIPFDVGRLAVSTQGRDQGRWMVVVGSLDQEHALVADGGLRKLEKPKKKRLKHLRATPYVAREIAQALSQGKHLLNSDVRKAISAAQDAAGQAAQSQGQEGGPAPKNQKEECALVKE
ncbi:MAG: KOW domain-containing RNA-binding protein [Candidatus Limiplasma sp.]|nr:KOW domain-containing RNA-binding protein [Candidatus Limiplasma sp.]